ncbi:hypothetical protein ACXR0O_14780 [Verrucomicrobiota bacterium sgz303538]
MNETKRQIAGNLGNHVGIVEPLSVTWHGGVPFMTWKLECGLLSQLVSANMILIDSPYYTPFRESVLLDVLNRTASTLIVLDDTRIPTLRRVCDRIAQQNPQLLHRRIEVGHTFDIFAKIDGAALRYRRSPLDIAKGWRRFVLGEAFYRRLANKSDD